MLSLLCENGASLKISKCMSGFGMREVNFLGHWVSSERLDSSAAHVESIETLLQPVSGEELMRFLRLANYRLRFVNNFPKMKRPLHEVLKNTGI